MAHHGQGDMGDRLLGILIEKRTFAMEAVVAYSALLFGVALVLPLRVALADGSGFSEIVVASMGIFLCAHGILAVGVLHGRDLALGRRSARISMTSWLALATFFLMAGATHFLAEMVYSAVQGLWAVWVYVRLGLKLVR